MNRNFLFGLENGSDYIPISLARLQVGHDGSVQEALSEEKRDLIKKLTSNLKILLPCNASFIR
jgi:hypothetical protein